MTVFDAYQVQTKLWETISSGEHRIIGFGGGIRGTKTWGTMLAVFALCRIFPRSRWAIVRKDLPTLRRNTVPSFNKLREELGTDFVGEINGTTWTATCKNGSEIIFFPESLDIDPDLSRWKGLEVNGFILEEADELAEKSYYKAIERAGAWLVPRGGLQPPAFVLCTFNPCANWPKHVFYEPWKNGSIAAPYAFIPATQADNPSISDAQREAWKSLPESEYNRFVMGDWESMAGRYYDTIDPRIHLIERSALPERLPQYWSYWGAFDWGYSHWAPFGYLAEDTDGNEYVLDTLWQRRQQDAEYASAIRASAPHQKCLDMVYAGGDCWAKPTARGGSGVSTYDVFLRSGILLRRADQDRANGGRALRRAFAFKRDENRFTQPPKFFLVKTEGNKRLLNQLLEIMPDPDKPNEPLKVNADSEGRGGDDGADMLRYGIASKRRAPSEPEAEVDDSNPFSDPALREAAAAPPRARRQVPVGVDLLDPDYGAF